MTIDTKANLDVMAGAREKFRAVEEAALGLLTDASLSSARGVLLVAKESVHLARLAVLEATERVQSLLGDGPRVGRWEP